jgi:2-C-methyl-D-erythritol 2,4-cyclodiphosphate synthase
MASEFRIGIGTDVHRLAVNKPFKLAGVTVPSPTGPAAHSDGDVVIHALCDAVAGAAGLPDIGELFSDTDAKNKNLDSAVFIKEYVRRAAEAGWRPVNMDAVVHLQWPKLAPHKPAMKAKLAELLGVTEDRVNVKAKTGERMGAVGEGRAVEAMVVVLLEKTAMDLKEP